MRWALVPRSFTTCMSARLTFAPCRRSSAPCRSRCASASHCARIDTGAHQGDNTGLKDFNATSGTFPGLKALQNYSCLPDLLGTADTCCWQTDPANLLHGEEYVEILVRCVSRVFAATCCD